MTSPTPQSERRRAARAAAAFPVRLSDKPGAEPAILRDISEIGLACTSPQRFAEMTMVGLDFQLPGQSETHHVQGAIVRCAAMGKGAGKGESGKWDLAVYFTDMQPTTRAALKNYVAKGKHV